VGPQRCVDRAKETKKHPHHVIYSPSTIFNETKFATIQRNDFQTHEQTDVDGATTVPGVPKAGHKVRRCNPDVTD
jgi:hypothetical protein